MRLTSQEILKRPPQSADAFARGCWQDPTPIDCYVAEGIFKAIAELAKVPCDRIRASDRFKQELRDLPFWDDYDNKKFCDTIDDVLGFSLTEKQADAVPSPEFSGKSLTVSEFVAKYRAVLDRAQEALILQLRERTSM